jgi:hypothetical protein
MPIEPQAHRFPHPGPRHKAGVTGVLTARTTSMNVDCF